MTIKNSVMMLLTCILMVLAAPAQANSFDLELKFDDVLQTIRLFEKENKTAEDKAFFLGLASTKAVLNKLEQQRRPVHEDDAWDKFVAASGSTFETDDSGLYYHMLASELEEVKALVHEIAANQKQIEAMLSHKLGALVDNGQRRKVTVEFVMGGPSMGWVDGGLGTQFIGLHFYKGDFKAIEATILHETVHLVQPQKVRKIDQVEPYLSPAELNAYYFLQRMYIEGTAEFLADLNDFSTENSPKVDELKDVINTNNSRPSLPNFVEHVIARSLAGAEEDEVQLYSKMLFRYGWQTPGYAHGKEMVKQVWRASENTDVFSLFELSPVDLMLKYLQIQNNDLEMAKQPGIYKELQVMQQKLRPVFG